jgi:hypothetical protein
MRSIVGQQVSVHAARSIWLRLEAAVPSMQPAAISSRMTDEQLRAVGLSDRQDEVRPQPRHRHRRRPHLDFACAARARRCGGHRHADAGQGHRSLDGRDLPDVRARPTRHHAGPRSRPRRGRAAPQEAAHPARRQSGCSRSPKPGGPGAAPPRWCSGTIAATCRTGAPGRRTIRMTTSDQTRRPHPRPPSRRQARPSRRPPARLRRRRQRPDRARAATGAN